MDELEYFDIKEWRPIGPPGWTGDPVEGWLQHFENIAENSLTEGDDINTAWGLGFIQGLVAGFGDVITREQADRFGGLVELINEDIKRRRESGGGARTEHLS